MTTLDDAQLAEMRQTLLGYAAHHAHTDAFREACAEGAHLIARHLAGEGLAAETAASIEAIFGTAAPIEIERMRAWNALDERLIQAARDDDPKAWVQIMVQALPYASEATVLGIMDMLHAARDDDDIAPGIPVSAWVHDMPVAIQ